MSRSSSRKLLALISVVALAIVAAGAYDEADVRERLESMTPEQIESLRRNHERFKKMNPEEQQRIRKLHSRLQEHQKSQRLKDVMSRYALWLQSLPAGQRAELISLPKEERLTKIRDIIKRQEQERFQRLVADQLMPQDRQALINWVRSIAGARKEELTKEFTEALPESYRDRFKEASETERTGMLAFMLLRFPERLNVQPEEYEALTKQLSGPARKTLEKTRDQEQRMLVLQQWLRIAAFSRMRFSGKREPIPEEKLTEFYEKLDERTKEYLNSLPSDRMKRELEAIYHNQWMRRRPSRGGRGGSSGFGGRRGSPGPSSGKP